MQMQQVSVCLPLGGSKYLTTDALEMLGCPETSLAIDVLIEDENLLAGHNPCQYNELTINRVTASFLQSSVEGASTPQYASDQGLQLMPNDMLMAEVSNYLNKTKTVMS